MTAPRKPRGVPRDEWRLALGIASDAVKPLTRRAWDNAPSGEDIGRLVEGVVYGTATIGANYMRHDRIGGTTYLGRKLAVEPYVVGAALMQVLTTDHAALDREFEVDEAARRIANRETLQQRVDAAPGATISIDLPVLTVEQMRLDDDGCPNHGETFDDEDEIDCRSYL